jgi:acetolactate synthase-1/2/3 large subunit
VVAVSYALLDAADLVIAVGLDTVEPMPAPWSSAAPAITISTTAPASSFVPAGVELVGPLDAGLSALLDGADLTNSWAADAGAAALQEARAALAAASSGTFGPIELTHAVARSAPPGVTVTVDAGAHFLAIMPFWPAQSAHQLLISNGLATMGFAVPAAIGAALARPERPVVCMTGDGGLGMTLAELETIARLRLPITVIVFDDATLSLIAIKQRPGQGGDAAVRYAAIDFAGVARSIGLDAASVDCVADLDRHLADGWDAPRLIDARIDPSAYPALIATTRG